MLMLGMLKMRTPSASDMSRTRNRVRFMMAKNTHAARHFRLISHFSILSNVKHTFPEMLFLRLPLAFLVISRQSQETDYFHEEK